MQNCILRSKLLTKCIQFSAPVHKLSVTARLLRPVELPSLPDGAKPSLYCRMKRKIGIYSVPRWRMKESSAYLYEASTDGIPFENFLTHCRLPDTFMSWFLVTEMHVWMIMQRAMLEGDEGRFLRDNIITRMWEDVDARMKKLVPLRKKVKKEVTQDLGYQFLAAIVAYDEGLLTDDKTLAGALWRTLLLYEEDDPLIIELLVKYIRAQVEHLSFIDRDYLLRCGQIEWREVKPLYP